jgi:hypothetical protein
MLKNAIEIYGIYILCLCATCFGHTGPSSANTFFKESTALCTSSVALLNYVIIIIIIIIRRLCCLKMALCGRNM